MNKVTEEQGQALLVAINKLCAGITWLTVGQVSRGEILSKEAVAELQQLGVPIDNI